MIESGRVKVNGKCVKADYKFKDNDFLESAVHRFVLNIVAIILSKFETGKLV